MEQSEFTVMALATEFLNAIYKKKNTTLNLQKVHRII